MKFFKVIIFLLKRWKVLLTFGSLVGFAYCGFENQRHFSNFSYQASTGDLSDTASGGRVSSSAGFGSGRQRKVIVRGNLDKEVPIDNYLKQSAFFYARAGVCDTRERAYAFKPCYRACHTNHPPLEGPPTSRNPQFSPCLDDCLSPFGVCRKACRDKDPPLSADDLTDCLDDCCSPFGVERKACRDDTSLSTGQLTICLESLCNPCKKACWEEDPPLSADDLADCLDDCPDDDCQNDCQNDCVNLGVIGSGFFYNSKKELLTNHHVIEGFSAPYRETNQNSPVYNKYVYYAISFFEGYKGQMPFKELVRVDWADEDADVAKVTLDGVIPEVEPVTFGDLNDVYVSSPIFTIGHPKVSSDKTLYFEVEKGDVVGFGQGAFDYRIYHSIRTYGGNSGGGLFDLATGKIIGIHHSVFSNRKKDAGVGTHINKIKELIEDPPGGAGRAEIHTPKLFEGMNEQQKQEAYNRLAIDIIENIATQ